MAISNLTNLNATFPWNLTSAVTGILPVANGGTGVNNGTRTITLSGGSENDVLTQNDSGNAVWGTPAGQGSTIPTSDQGDTLYASASNVFSALAKDTNATRYMSNTGSNNNPAWAQVDLANGVTGNLPVGNLASGTGATSSTFFRGDGSWAQALYQGNQILISTQTASASASIVFANFVNAAYRNYILKIQFIQPATDGQTLIAEVSNDGGSNYLNSGYQWSRVYASDGVVAQQGATNSAAFELNRGQINTDYCNAVFEIQVLGAGTKLRLLGKSYSWIPGPFQEILDQGANVNGTTLNTLRIKYPSGNIATGIVSLYGILA